MNDIGGGVWVGGLGSWVGLRELEELEVKLGFDLRIIQVYALFIVMKFLP